MNGALICGTVLQGSYKWNARTLRIIYGGSNPCTRAELAYLGALLAAERLQMRAVDGESCGNAVMSCNLNP